MRNDTTDRKQAGQVLQMLAPVHASDYRRGAAPSKYV
jgi:hypothetical protein